MKRTIQKHEVEVCDFCNHEGYLQKCWVCKREFCLTHEGTGPASWGFTTICQACAGREDVRRVCDKCAAKVTSIFQARYKALKRLPSSTETESQS